MSRHQRFWTFTRKTFCQALSRRYRLALEPGSDPEPKPPFIVVCNHGNFFDPWFLGHFQKTALHIMMNDDGFRAGALSRWYLTAIGAFPKKKGAQDLKAMKSTLSFLKAGEPVLIFPEGQATWDGETQPVYGGIERMVKRAKCPLIVMRLTGGFLSKPWWAEGPRKGRILVSRKVYAADEIARMDAAQVLSAIRKGIYNDDISNERNKDYPFKGKRLAEGLQRLLWSCPRCEGVDVIAAAGDLISCTSCGGVWRVDPHCGVSGDEGRGEGPENVHTWHSREKAAARRRVSEAAQAQVICANDGVIMSTEGEDGSFETRGAGRLELTKEKLGFTPDAGGGAMEIPLADVKNYVIQRKDVFEVTFDGRDYRFEMIGKSPMKWLLHVRYLKGWAEVETRGVI